MSVATKEDILARIEQNNKFIAAQYIKMVKETGICHNPDHEGDELCITCYELQKRGEL